MIGFSFPVAVAMAVEELELFFNWIPRGYQRIEPLQKPKRRNAAAVEAAVRCWCEMLFNWRIVPFQGLTRDSPS